MSRPTPTLLLAFVSLAILPLVTRAQSPAPSSASDAPQTSGQGSGQNSTQQAPAKKIWTNEDMSNLRDESVISTFSPAHTKSAAPSTKTTSKGKDAKWYGDNITKLQMKIPPLNEQIAELQAAIDGKPTGNGAESARPRGVKADSWPVEMDELQKQRDHIQSQIDALYDDARRNNIPNGALPLQQ
jgi:hypothetical protein